MTAAPKKRIICLSDGTWEDGLSQATPSGYTNITRLARALEKYDTRTSPPILQLVYYSSGLGSDSGTFGTLQGFVGSESGLANKIEQLYSFVAQNYSPGDELFFFGFSRGAYEARMVADLVGKIGFLTPTEMETFPSLFIALQKQGQHPDSAEIHASTEALLAPYRLSAKTQAAQLGTPFVINCVCVFDTVGSLGLPEEIKAKSPSTQSLFGFSNTDLGSHIAFAYQALALDETRKDFLPTKWHQIQEGRDKGQVLKQVWFSGSHCDIGGGWDQHDLADLTLAWVVTSTDPLLAYNFEYINSIPCPVAPYGQQAPHNPRTGVYTLTEAVVRKHPTETNDKTHETVHSSVLCQPNLNAAYRQTLVDNPTLVEPLVPGSFEELFKDVWKSKEGQPLRPQPTKLAQVTSKQHPTQKVVASAVHLFDDLVHKISD